MSSPRLPPAPGRLSTTICHFSVSPSLLATRRVSESVPPPGGLGTMKRIGLSGQAWAWASAGSAAKAAASARAATSRETNLGMRSPRAVHRQDVGQGRDRGLDRGLVDLGMGDEADAAALGQGQHAALA